MRGPESSQRRVNRVLVLCAHHEPPRSDLGGALFLSQNLAQPGALPHRPPLSVAAIAAGAFAVCSFVRSCSPLLLRARPECAPLPPAVAVAFASHLPSSPLSPLPSPRLLTNRPPNFPFFFLQPTTRHACSPSAASRAREKKNKREQKTINFASLPPPRLPLPRQRMPPAAHCHCDASRDTRSFCLSRLARGDRHLPVRPVF